MEGTMMTLIYYIYLSYYKDFIHLYICGRKCMYAEAKKAIYGTLEASPLFWEKLSKILEKNGLPNKKIWLVCNEK